jgi:NAD(P)-dependent dehydrogenase (short-subunit alcohol dehydrogenase family)
VTEAARLREADRQVAVVTGAANGIGAACARAFATKGLRVALVDHDAENLAALAATLEGCLAISSDVASSAAVADAFTQVIERFGRIDALVNSAGVESVWTIENMPEADWDRVLDVNLKGTMLCTQAALPGLRAAGGGAVVNIASIAGKRMSYNGGASYTASKAGVLGFTRHAAFELGIHAIRVNAVCPGPTLTPMILRNTTEAQRAAIVKIVPLARWVRPEDVAQAVLFLASDAAGMITGTALDVDGGVLVSNGSSYQDYFARRR